MAHRLARAFGTSPELWLGLQHDVDLSDTHQARRKEYKKIKRVATPENGLTQPPEEKLVKRKKRTNIDGLEGVEAALQRAALRAREIAAQTGTPLVIWKNGKTVKLMISPKEVTKAPRK